MSSNIWIQVLILVLCIIIPNLPGTFYGFDDTFRTNLEEWYQKLNFPSGRPPDWVFGPVWVTLYTLMGIASFLVYKTGGGWFTKISAVPITAYIVQLLLNWIWTPIFFYWKQLLLASIEIVMITVAAAITGILFYRVNKWAGLMFIPYLAWLTYATQFAIRIYFLNN